MYDPAMFRNNLAVAQTLAGYKLRDHASSAYMPSLAYLTQFLYRTILTYAITDHRTLLLSGISNRFYAVTTSETCADAWHFGCDDQLCRLRVDILHQ